MAQQMTVELKTIRLAQNVCNTAIHGLQGEARGLKRAYAAAGSGWNDAVYRKVGAVIQDAVDALDRPVRDLEDSMERLKKIEGLIQQINGIKF